MAEEIKKEPFELYGGKVKGLFYPKSHRYYITHKKGTKLDKNYMPISVTSISEQVDKSRVLMKWATGLYTKTVVEFMRDGENFTREDVVSMLQVGERAHTEFKERAAGIGDYVHKFCEEYSKDLDPVESYNRMIAELGEPSDEMKTPIDNGVQGFVKWIEKEKAKIIEAEQVVYSVKHDFVGKFDAILQIGKKKYLTDYKTSNGIYNEHYYQSSAYLKAKEEETGEKFDGALIVGIVKEDKKDKYREVKAGQIITEFRSREDLEIDYDVFVGLIPLRHREKELQALWRAKNKK